MQIDKSISSAEEKVSGGSVPCVSIIVPVYNVSAYLDRCLESLTSQTLENIEIIVVNDGSTDDSADICERWAQRDARIRYFSKPNGGLSDARNYGIERAVAPYLGFVDSDDVVSPSMYEGLYGMVVRSGCQLACCDVMDIHEGGSVGAADLNADTSPDFDVLSSEEALRRSICSELPRIWVPTKLYDRAIFEDGLRFPVGKTYEDAYTLVDVFSRANQVAVCDARYYGYFHRRGSITAATFSKATMDVVDAWENVTVRVKELYPSLEPDVAFRRFWARAIVLDKLTLAKHDDSALKADLVAYMKANFASVEGHPCVTGSRRMLTKALLVAFPLYAAALRLSHLLKRA